MGRSARERLSPIIEAVKDLAVIMLDASGLVMGWNAGAERLKGYSADAIIGRHFACFYTRAAAAEGQPAKALAIAAATGHFAHIGQRVRRDGSVYWAEVILHAMRDTDGSLLGFAKVVRDLTDNQVNGEELHAFGADSDGRRLRSPDANGERSEQSAAGRARLEHTQSLLSAIVESSDAAIASCDPALRLTSWNRGAERIFGYSVTEAIGQPVGLMAPQAQKAEIEELVEWLRRGEVIRDFETQGLRKDGALIDIALTASLITGLNDEPLGMSFIARDISQECEARRALEETKEWLRQILDHAPLMVTAIDRNGVYTMAEGQTLKAMGLNAQETLMGRSACAIPGLDSVVADATRRALEGETTMAAATMNGHTFDMWKAPIRDADGRITGVIGVSTDVSRRVAIEQELQSRLRQQEMIAAISASALRGAPFDDLAREAAESARAALGVDCTGVFVRKDNGSSFEARVLAAASTIAADINNSGFAQNHSLAAYAVSTSAPVIADDLAAESRFEPDPLAHRLGLTSAIAIAFGPPGPPARSDRGLRPRRA